MKRLPEYIPENQFLSNPDVDPVVAKNIYNALYGLEAYDTVFGLGRDARTRKTHSTQIKPGFEYTIPLGDEPYSETSKVLFINGVKNKSDDIIKCRMNLIDISLETGEQNVEASWKYYFKKGDLVFAFDKEIEEEKITHKLNNTKMIIGGLTVTVAGITVVAVEEILRHKHKNKKAK